VLFQEKEKREKKKGPGKKWEQGKKKKHDKKKAQGKKKKLLTRKLTPGGSFIPSMKSQFHPMVSIESLNFSRARSINYQLGNNYHRHIDWQIRALPLLQSTPQKTSSYYLFNNEIIFIYITWVSYCCIVPMSTKQSIDEKNELIL